jgi:hypothetical protein
MTGSGYRHPAAGGDVIDDLLTGIELAARNDHPRAVLGQAETDRSADPATAPRDDRNLAAQIEEFHARSRNFSANPEPGPIRPGRR